MTFEDTAKKIENSCKLYREIVQLLPVIRSVLARFDGKVYNKLFVNAINAEAEKRYGKDLYVTSDYCEIRLTKRPICAILKIAA